MNSLGGRMSWSLKMQQEYAMPVYQEYWQVSPADITEVDAHGQDETAAKRIDASGIDKIVEPSTGVRHVAQRFRSLSELPGGDITDPDFSIRISSYSDKDTEYDKLMAAYRGGGNIPKVYTFGVGGSESRDACLRVGFKHFYFLRLPRFLKLHESGAIEACAAYPNGDGSKALYFDIDHLRDNGIVQHEVSGSVLSSAWSDRPTSDDFPNAPGIERTGQVKLHEYGGGG